METRPARARPFETLHQVILGLALATAVVFVLEAAQGDLRIDLGRGEMSRISVGTDGSLRLRIHDDSESLSMKSRGPLALTADESSVAELQAGGWLEVEHLDVDDHRHELKVRAGSDGRPEHVYRLDGEPADFDTAGRRWFRGVALVLYRRVGIDAEARAGRLGRQGGLPRLLEEVEQIRSDSVAATYLESALALVGPGGEDLVVWLEASRDIDSDYYATRLLSRLETPRLAAPPVLAAFADLGRELESDHYLGELLVHHVSRLPELPSADARAVAEGLLSMAEGLESNHHLARVLEVHARARVDDPAPDGTGLPGFDGVLRLLGRLESDHYIAGTIEILAEAASGEQLPRLIDASGAIESDHHLAHLLASLAEDHPAEARRPGTPLREAIDRALRRVESDHHRRQVSEVLAR